MSDFEVQVRSEETGIQNFSSLYDALKESRLNPTIWKISFTLPQTNERVRLIRLEENRWGYAPILEELSQ